MKLDVWLEGKMTPVGTLERLADKTLRFTYSADATLPISASMTVRQESYGDAACVAYFGNLLFEGQALEHVVAAHGLDRDDIGSLLYHLGTDCAGAISITPEGTGPGKYPGRFPHDYEEIDHNRMRAIITSLHRHGRLPDGERDPSPVAGIQPKLAVVYHDKKFYQPKVGSKAPTTHILKVSPRSDLAIAKYEAALLGFAATIDIVSAETQFLEFIGDDGEEIGAVLSTRFDRRVDDSCISRLHCEDFCQALGLSKVLKYERNAQRDDLRFSAKAIGRIASQSAVPANFQIDFFKQTLFNLAVGNTDNHAKNGTILYRGKYGVLAPLYDVVPITINPHFTHQLAFKIGDAEWTEDVTVDNIEKFMGDIGFGRKKFEMRWLDFLSHIAKEGVPYFAAQGGKPLADGIAAQLTVLQEALKLNLDIPGRDYFPRPIRDQG